MCEKEHANAEEAIACRDDERKRREGEFSRRLRRFQNIEMALSDTLRQIERAQREGHPEYVLANEGLIDQIKRALEP